jgi:hypothetical protein
MLRAGRPKLGQIRELVRIDGLVLAHASVRLAIWAAITKPESRDTRRPGAEVELDHGRYRPPTGNSTRLALVVEQTTQKWTH